MEDQLQVALTDILNKTVEATGKATDFLLSEMPEVIQQLLMWKMVESLVMTFISFLLIFGVVFSWALVAEKWSWISDKNAEPLVIIPGIAITMFFSSVALAILNLTWLQIWIAPKAYLIEYAASLAK